MHTTQRPRIVAAIAIMTLWAASAQAQTQQVAKVRITSTASDALCVGGAGVTPSACDGGAQVGKLGIGKSPVNPIDVLVDVDSGAYWYFKNINTGTSAETKAGFENGASDILDVGVTGANFTTSGIFAARMAFLHTSATAGLGLGANSGPVSISAEGNINNESVRIESGRVGIGLGNGVTPSYRLDVGVAGTGDLVGMRLYRASASSGDKNALLWQSSTLQTGSISDEVTSGTTGSVVVKTNAGSGLAEQFRVTPSGIRIGTYANVSAIAANTLRLVNGGSSASPVPQELQVYGYHDGTNYESIFLRHTGDGVGRIGLRSSGTTDRSLNVYLAGDDRFQFNADGNYFTTLSGYSLGTTSDRWGGIYGTGTGLDLKGAGTSRMRQYVDPSRNDVWITSANYAGTLGAGTQDSGSLPSWLTYFDLRAGADNFLIARYPAGSSTEAALVIVESDGVIKNNGVAITTSAGKLVGSAITGLSGSWTSKSSDTVYYADTAGWAVVLVACGDYPEDCGAQVSMLTDASNPPTTARDYGSVDSYHSAVNQSGARAFVRAGDYWKAVSSTISGSPAVTVWWQPIGG